MNFTRSKRTKERIAKKHEKKNHVVNDIEKLCSDIHNFFMQINKMMKKILIVLLQYYI